MVPRRVPGPTAAQAGAWDAISTGQHALVVAPTGSGKTLASFLWSIDRLISATDRPPAKQRTRVLYVSPLKALGVDVERNLRSPLVGITQTARRLGTEPPEVTVGVRSGDTPSSDRQRLLRQPPDILITTPESLYLMLTSQARETLVNVDTVIVDEVHAVASTKRGATWRSRSNDSTTCSRSPCSASVCPPPCAPRRRSHGSSVDAPPCRSSPRPRRRPSTCASSCRSTT